jgi:dienelactone hydrolase
MYAPWSTDTASSWRENTSRRRFLGTACTVATVLVAGCSGDDGEDDTSPTSTPEPTDTPTSTPEPTETSTPAPTETETQTQADPDPAALERRAREFLVLLAEGSFETAYSRFNEAAQEGLTVAALEQVWGQVTAGAGEFVSIDTAEYQDTTNGVSVVSVEAVFDQVRNTFTVALRDAGVNGFELTSQDAYAWEAPAYADESSFTEEQVALDTTESCELGGTLTLPDGDEPVPGVVIVHGSGPNDRDGTFGPNKPYKELAWGLASRGVAVLRYDKRTNACDLDLSDVTIDDVATDDALTAVERLRDHDRVAADSVFLAGHSLGGVLAPRIATRDGNLAGAVMLAPGPVRPMAETVLDQQRHLLEQQDLTDEEREQALAEFQATAEKIRSLDIGDDEVLLGLGGREYFRTLEEYDGPETAAGLDIPLFLAMGGRDYQVTVEKDLPVWQDALSGNSTVTVEVYDDLNHLFQRGDGPSTASEYVEPDAVFDRRVVEDVAAFVGRHA